MNNIDWIKELVITEQQMEDTGTINLSAVSLDAHLDEQTLEFMQDIKAGFVEAAATFNQFKGSAVGTLKIYGISNTKADFMLFRNGYKLIFSIKRAGEIEVYSSIMSTHFLTGAQEQEAKPTERDSIRAHWGAYGELQWHNKNLPVKLDYLIRYYLSRFVRESTK
ncbi:MAG: hypothetical protein A2Z20_05685 [Bdellovibrionales bacterium RBG_16_40_8]|nr:MAG: hypothetical protein A2Z20_05685 [Bdellovibrionales bacterium RBG_16_40_8]